jgi:hypothetical protein
VYYEKSGSFNSHAPAETKIKLPWIEEFVNDLLDPVGRARRARRCETLAASKPMDHRGR